MRTIEEAERIAINSEFFKDVFGNFEDRTSVVSHWQPLPAPPKGEAK